MIARAVRIAFVVLVLDAVTHGALYAQCTGTGPAGVWPPHGTLNYPEASAADRTAFEATLAAVEQIIRKTPYATPHGFEEKSQWMYSAPLDRTRLSRFDFALSLWCPSIKATGGDGETVIRVFINPAPDMWSDPSPRDEKGNNIYLEGIHSATRFGSIATFGEFEETSGAGLRVLFTRGDVSPTVPVSREEYLRSLIWEVEGKDAGKKSAFQEYVDGAAERKKANDELVAMIAKSDPKQAAELRKTLEKAERDNADMWKQADASGAALRTGAGDRYRAQIAAMTAAQKASPAFASGNDLVEPGSFDAHPVVRENPAFYRAGRSPTEPRAVLVWLTHNYDKQLKDVRAQFYREFDWAAIKRLVSGNSP